MRRRKHFTPAVFLALVLASGLTPVAQRILPPAPRPAAWQTFSPPSKLFSAQFPGAPTYLSVPVDYGFYKTTLHRYRLDRIAQGGAMFEISYVQMPPNDGGVPPGIILDATIDTVMKPLSQKGGKEAGRSEVLLNGCTGREYIATVSDETFLQGRVFLSGEQIINAFYVAPLKLASYKQTAQRFFSSLAITEACAAAPTSVVPLEGDKKLGTVSGVLDAATGWRLIAPERSGFSALMPSVAESEEEKAQEKPYPLTLRSYFARDGSTIYGAVECGDFPPETARIPNFDEIKLNIAYRALVNETKALDVQITVGEEIKIGGHAGRQYRLTSATATGQARIISTPQKFYMFIVFGTPNPAPLKLDRFFSSIKFKK
jgi:hypothetical protein